MKIHQQAFSEAWSHMKNYETEYWKSACQRNAVLFTLGVSRSCGEKMCLAKICIFILTSKWERSEFRPHGQSEVWNFLSVQHYVLYCHLSLQSPALLPQPYSPASKQQFSCKDKRIVVIIGYRPPGAQALQKHFCGCLLAARKCWARDLGFHSQQYALSGTEAFSLISFIYFCSPLSPLTVISQSLRFIHSLIVHLCTTDPCQTSFLSTLFPFSFLTQICSQHLAIGSFTLIPSPNWPGAVHSLFWFQQIVLHSLSRH